MHKRMSALCQKRTLNRPGIIPGASEAENDEAENDAARFHKAIAVGAGHSDPKIEFNFLNVYLVSCLRREK